MSEHVTKRTAGAGPRSARAQRRARVEAPVALAVPVGAARAAVVPRAVRASEPRDGAVDPGVLDPLRGRTLVVKYGGAVMGEPALAASWASEVAALASIGARVVVVHGGGPALSRALSRMGIETVFVEGHRVTTAETAEVAEMVLSGRINKEVVSLLVRAGARAVGLSGTDARILGVRPLRPEGRDIGFVGEVESVSTGLLTLLLDAGYTPVLSSTAADGAGQVWNINADLVAGAVAAALGAARTVFLSDVPGLLSAGTLVASLTAREARALLEDGDVTGGMRPKIEGALAALDGGAQEVVFADGRLPGALARALAPAATDGSTGTRIVPAIHPSVGTPRSQDVAHADSLAAVKATTPAQSSASPKETGFSRALAVQKVKRPTVNAAGTPAPEPPTWAGTLAARGGAAVMATYARYPIEIVSGRGCRVHDGAGRTLLDFAAGIAVNVLGHGHPAIDGALRAAAAAGVLHTSNLYWTEPMVRLAERLTSAAGMERAFFCNSGAEAIETALKLARKARPGRERIVVFDRSFHGRTMGALSATIQPAYQDPFRPLLPGMVAIPFGDEDAASRVIDERTAAVLVEPIQGEGGVRPAPPGWLAHLRAACDRTGALLVLDEVQTGIGRTGRFFAYQHERVVPDAVACAKALAAGLPMGALLARGEAASALGPGEHGSTFGGGPFVSTVAHAVLDVVLAPGFLDEVRTKGERLGLALGRLAGESEGLVTEVRGRGLMWGMVLRAPDAPGLVDDLHAAGLLTVPAGKDVLRLLPPLVVSIAEIAEAAGLIGEALRARAAPRAPAGSVA